MSVNFCLSLSFAVVFLGCHFVASTLWYLERDRQALWWSSIAQLAMMIFVLSYVALVLKEVR